MPGNSFGQLFKITTFGESHGKGIGVVIDGCPAGLEISYEFIANELQRRKPGQSSISTDRNESEAFDVLSGVSNSITTGAPICFFIHNTDAKSTDYDALKDVYRPSHADYTYEAKYGLRIVEGGGRSSARETAARVLAGAIAKILLRKLGIEIKAYVAQIGTVQCNDIYTDVSQIHNEVNSVRCPDNEIANDMIRAIEQAKQDGDTLGGIVRCVIQGTPAGWGEPVFDRLEADLAKAMLSINATKGFELGSGFKAASMKGSEHNDEFEMKGDKVSTKTNFSGGIQGGISNGMNIYFAVAFKPVSSIRMQQKTINKEGNEIQLQINGRHDPCVVPRAVPIVEAMAALVLADHYLRNLGAKI